MKTDSKRSNISRKKVFYMVRKIILENFKAFKKAEIEIKPLTIVTGPNSGGKSSLLQSICLIQQTLKGSGADILKFIGTVNFGDFDNILHQNSKIEEIRIRFDFDEGTYFDVTICKKDDVLSVKNFSCDTGELEYKLENLNKVELDNLISYIPGNYSINLKQDKKYNDYFTSDFKPDFYSYNFFILPHLPQKNIENFISSIISDTNTNDNTKNVVSNALLNKSNSYDKRIIVDYEDEIRLENRLLHLETNLNSFYGSIKQKFESIVYLGPIRNTGDRVYEVGHFENVGYRGEHAVQIIEENLYLRQELARILQMFGIANSIQLLKGGSKDFQLKLRMNDKNSTVNLADVGSGTSQLLPILVQLLLSKNDTLFVIEEPETHLHPKLQADIATFLVSLLKDKAKFLIETHSEYFIDRIRTCVLENPSLAEHIIIYYVEQDIQEKQSKIIPINFNSKGQYSNTPSGYLTNFRMQEIDTQIDLMLKNLKNRNKYD